MELHYVILFQMNQSVITNIKLKIWKEVSSAYADKPQLANHSGIPIARVDMDRGSDAGALIHYGEDFADKRLTHWEAEELKSWLSSFIIGGELYAECKRTERLLQGIRDDGVGDYIYCPVSQNERLKAAIACSKSYFTLRNLLQQDDVTFKKMTTTGGKGTPNHGRSVQTIFPKLMLLLGLLRI